MGTKDQILQACCQLFQEKSYNNTSIDDICAKCRLTKPAFYYHFSAQSDLLLHYYDDVINHLHHELGDKTFQDNYW